MKVLVQHAHSCHYLARGKWVESVTEAEDFHVTARAYDMAKQSVTGAFNIVFSFSDKDRPLIVATGIGVAREIIA